MNTKPSQPPYLAVWLLFRLHPERNREAITGDLLERFYDGHTASWFWRQVLIAILIGVGSQARFRWTELWLAGSGTALIWYVPWNLVIPNSDTKWSQFFALEVATSLPVLPLFAILLHRERTRCWVHLLWLFFVTAILFAVGDLLTISSATGYFAVNRPGSTSLLVLQLVWSFATLLISARAARLDKPFA